MTLARPEYATLLTLCAAAKAPKAEEDDMDLFGDEAGGVDVKAALKKVAEPKKAKKAVIAKSSIQMEAMPNDADTDITDLYNKHIKSINIDGLVWGPVAKVVPGPFGLKKLVFGCAIEDDKVMTESIEEAVETIGMKPEDAKRYLELRRSGDLDDCEEEWEGKIVRSVVVTAFQKV